MKRNARRMIDTLYPPAADEPPVNAWMGMMSASQPFSAGPAVPNMSACCRLFR